MGREDQIPRLARVTLETLTPLHIGSGLSLVWTGQGWADCQQVLQGARLGASDEPYVPGSTLRGMLRGMYAFSLEMQGRSEKEADRAADAIFGSTDQAGQIAFSDLFPTTAVAVAKQGETLVCHCSRYLQPGSCSKRQATFIAQVVPSQTVFAGEVSSCWSTQNPHLAYLETVLSKILRYGKQLTNTLRANGQNPEVSILSSPINGLLFQQSGRQYIITWKLGKYAKAYSKAMTRQPRLKTKPPAQYPYAYYVVRRTGELLGWVKLTIDFAPCDEKGQPITEFRLNEWPEEVGR